MESDFRMPTTLSNPTNRKTYTREKGKSFLGSGSFGFCYLFKEKASQREVAVKVSKTNTPEEHKKLRNEADMQGQFKHPNVVQMLGCFVQEGLMFILLEYCSNNSLKELINRRKTITEPESRYYIRQVVCGIEHIHTQKFVHRDLKLENVFLNAQLHAKIGDFGMAARIRGDEARRSFCGTPNYMAPEIVGDENYTYEVDIWAIGCMLYALLYGKSPFAPRLYERGLRGTYDRIQRVQYELPADAPSATRSVISALLQRNPAYRPQANEVLKQEFFKLPTPKWLPSTALAIEPDITAMDIYETIRMQKIAPMCRPLAAIGNQQQIGRRATTETEKKADTEGGGERDRGAIRQVYNAMARLHVEDDHTVRVIPTSSRLSIGCPAPSLWEHAHALNHQLNGLLSRLSSVPLVSIQDMYRSRVQSPASAPRIWVARWIYRLDELLAYSLSDESYGCGFTDGSFMQMDRRGQRMTYVDKQLAELPFCVDEEMRDVPVALRDKTSEMWDLVRRLHGLNILSLQHNTSDNVDYLSREPLVRVWEICEEYAAMWLSTGLLQVNWRLGEQRVKMFICPLMQAVSFLDSHNQFITLKFDTLLTQGCSQLHRGYIAQLPSLVSRLLIKLTPPIQDA